MARRDREREEAIQRVMLNFDMDREAAESIVDRTEGRLFNLDDAFNLGETPDVDISDQVTRLILPKDEQHGE